MESDNNNNINSDVMMYKECLRNHAASLGSYATDGCGEFTSDETSSTLQCAACGCHRNFHKKVAATAATPYKVRKSNSSGSSRDINMMPMSLMDHQIVETEGGSSKLLNSKRFRTKFSEEQKEKMLEFAEKLGWKLQRRDEEDEVEKFCRGIGVTRQVFKVWMHNHKTTTNNSSSNISSVSANSSAANANSSLTTIH